MRALLLLTLLASLTMMVDAQEVLTIESTITGSQEQPKVISIVPWQQPKAPDYFGDDISGLGSSADIFQPLDRDTFNRERDYISSMRKAAHK